MADKTIDIIKVKRDEANEVTYTSIATSDKVMIPWDCKDESTVLRFLGGSAEATITIKAGKGVQATNDLTISVGNGKYVDVPINSGMFMNTYGDDAGNVVLSTSAACSLAVVEEL
ncbi:MAG: hypothetical protein ACLRLX_01825 [Anaerovoracaceae bacterium]|jgi:hypothetical protein